ADGLRAHRDDELRLDDVKLPCEPACCLARLLGPELEAVGPVDSERIDVQALQGLEDGLSRATEEGDALLDLGWLRRVLEEEDVGERMSRADHGYAQLVAGPRELVA